MDYITCEFKCLISHLSPSSLLLTPSCEDASFFQVQVKIQAIITFNLSKWHLFLPSQELFILPKAIYTSNVRVCTSQLYAGAFFHLTTQDHKYRVYLKIKVCPKIYSKACQYISLSVHWGLKYKGFIHVGFCHWICYTPSTKMLLI